MNSLWIISLILSVACTIWSQVTSRWISSAQQYPSLHWAGPIIRLMPLSLLCGASVSFSCGVVCLAFSIFPHTATPIITSTLIGLLAASCLLVVGWWTTARFLSPPPWRFELVRPWDSPPDATDFVPEKFPEPSRAELWVLPNELYLARSPSFDIEAGSDKYRPRSSSSFLIG